jgi:hypothetical protein
VPSHNSSPKVPLQALFQKFLSRVPALKFLLRVSHQKVLSKVPTSKFLLRVSHQKFLCKVPASMFLLRVFHQKFLCKVPLESSAGKFRCKVPRQSSMPRSPRSPERPKELRYNQWRFGLSRTPVPVSGRQTPSPDNNTFEEKPHIEISPCAGRANAFQNSIK